MTMKKRFLGLALAAMVAVPATTAYAATDSQTITGNENSTQRHQVTVTGTVNNKQGEAPAGIISVELPTKMAFAVDQAGTFTGSSYNVNNTGKVNVDISVADFSESNSSGGIEILPESAFSNVSEKYRSQVSLSLTGRENSIDLGEFDPNASSGTNKLVSLAAGTSGSIVLEGLAGTKAASDGGTNEQQKVDNEGAKEEFTLVFKINKSN